ncbi:MAG: FAD-binding protein [Gammaproteobacteria bacterium]
MYLSFTHIAESELRAAFGPVVDRLLANGIDLRETPVEVAPIAHYHMGGIEVDEHMATRVTGLYAAGEAVGGAGGANRLSGNAITEALVFGEIAGREAAAYLHGSSPRTVPAEAPGPLRERRAKGGKTNGQTDRGVPDVAALGELRALMWRHVGPFRTRTGLEIALARIRDLRDEHVGGVPTCGEAVYANTLFDAYELRDALTVAEAVAGSALAREESRGAHQREDFPQTDPGFQLHVYASSSAGQVEIACGALLSQSHRRVIDARGATWISP